MTTTSMESKTVLVTGASSGLGKATARALAAMGARVIMACRDPGRGATARGEIVAATGSERVDLLIADLSTRDAIRGLAREVTKRYERLDVLVNNAGLVTARRRLTPEGFEMVFFVNHLAYFMMALLLVDRLRASAPARIVNVASSAHSSGTIDLDDLQLEHGHYAGWKQYANTKLMNVVFTYELARRLEGTGVTANCAHPGVVHTGLLRRYSRVLTFLWNASQALFRKPEEGADTQVYLASSPEVEGVTGRYFRRREAIGTSQVSYDRDLQRGLWEASERIAGITSPV